MPQAPLPQRQRAAVLAALAAGATIAEAAAVGRCSTASVDRIKRAERARDGAKTAPASRPRLVAALPLTRPSPPPPEGAENEDVLDLSLPFTTWCQGQGRLVVDAAMDHAPSPDRAELGPDEIPEPTPWDIIEAGTEPAELAYLVRCGCVTRAEAVEVLEEALRLVRTGEDHAPTP